MFCLVESECFHQCSNPRFIWLLVNEHHCIRQILIIFFASFLPRQRPRVSLLYEVCLKCRQCHSSSGHLTKIIAADHRWPLLPVVWSLIRVTKGSFIAVKPSFRLTFTFVGSFTLTVASGTFTLVGSNGVDAVTSSTKTWHCLALVHI